MTLTEATQKGIARLRRPMWPDEAYLKIDLFKDGRGPWGHLFSRGEQKIIGEPTPQTFLCVQDDTSDYEAYLGPLDEADNAANK